MIYDKATIKDIDALTDLRLAYLEEDFGDIATQDVSSIKKPYRLITKNTLTKI